MSKHLWGDVPGDTHDRLIACLGFGKFGDGVVPQVVESQPRKRTLDVADVSLTFLVAAGFGGIL